ncbi:hypothetical protein D3C71_1938310 [compost metagenome]
MQELGDFRRLLLQPLAADAIDGFRCTVNTFGIVKEAQLPLGEHPVRYPAGHGNGLFLLFRAGQLGNHPGTGTGLQFVVQAVVLDGLVGLEHHA